MDANDRAAVAEYLDGGGHLLYTSPRSAAALGEPVGSTNPNATDDMAPFLADYFGATYLDTEQVGGGNVIGTGDILGTGPLRLTVFPGRPLQDVFTSPESANGAVTPLAKWDKGGDDALMGLRVEGNAEHHGFRTVFLGFNPEQLTAGANAVSVISRTLGWLGVTPGGYPIPTNAVIRHTGVQQSFAGAAIPINAYVVGTTLTPS